MHPPSPTLRISYQFTDSTGEERTDSMYLSSINPAIPIVGDKIDIEYLPGPNGETRRTGKDDCVSIFAFLGLLMFDGWLFRLWLYSLNT